jgi:hypothetical protein
MVGGGPITGGEQAPRYPKLLQRAFWTGWKKLHGLKWQTVDLPNGMNYEIWGSASVRHNDNFTLAQSNILNSMADDQLAWEKKFKLLGDSAYSRSLFLEIVGDGRGWSSLREAIEWDYKDLKQQWKYMDYRHALKLKNQPVSKIVFICMLLRNAHVTMNGCQASIYFTCDPPSFEDWISQGPQAHPIPDGIVF